MLQCDRASSNWWFSCWEIGGQFTYCQWQIAIFWSRDATISHLRDQRRQGRNHCGNVPLSLIHSNKINTLLAYNVYFGDFGGVCFLGEQFCYQLRKLLQSVNCHNSTCVYTDQTLHQSQTNSYCHLLDSHIRDLCGLCGRLSASRWAREPLCLSPLQSYK